MEFRTSLEPKKSTIHLGLNDPLITVGSCFADHLGKQLADHKFNCLVNPFGTTYNPISIHQLLSYAIDLQFPGADTYGSKDGMHFNFDFHSSFTRSSLRDVQDAVKRAIEETHAFLHKARVLMITYGTSFVYVRRENGKTVSNCHKLPAYLFDKELLSQKSILESFESLLPGLQRLNPGLEIVLTVSPVRHIKDTLELNAVSKSVLRLTTHTLTTQHAHVQYFPAYEILLDDLRDYRFYADDLIHPSPAAIEYIWEKFKEVFLTDDALGFTKSWSEVRKALKHRAFNPQSPGHQQFLTLTIQKLNELSRFVDVSKEISELKKQVVR